ncbi:MAG: DNA adenine methylase [Tepidiformaceae bacterium]
MARLSPEQNHGNGARPFLKWAGGKAKLAPTILERAPQQFGRFHEPFLGAGAVFFALQATCAQRATLTDVNPALVETFNALCEAPATVARALAALADQYLRAEHADRPAVYYKIRALAPASSVERAARLIFLNRTCFNGLYRENRSGEFNVPHGRYLRPKIVDEALLHACSAALQSAEIRCGDFHEACELAQPGDFVYLDPPYYPLSATASFTAYSRSAFGPPEQRRLRDAFDDLTRRGVAAILSNSDHPAVRELYEGRGYRMDIVTMSRSINSVGTKRASIPELLISNFPPDRPRR